MAESEKEPAASLTDPIIKGSRLGGSPMFMGGPNMISPVSILPLTFTDISQNNYQKGIGNPMFATTIAYTADKVAMLGREMMAFSKPIISSAIDAAEPFVDAGAEGSKWVAGKAIGKVVNTPQRLAQQAFYGQKLNPIPSQNPSQWYRDYREIASPKMNARLNPIAGGLGVTTVEGVLGKIASSAFRGSVFSAAMPVLEMGDATLNGPAARYARQRQREEEAQNKMITQGVADFRKEALAAGRNPDMAWLTELPAEPLWKTDINPVVTQEEKALGNYEKVLEARTLEWRKNEEADRSPTFNAKEDKGHWISAHFLRQ